MTLTELRDAIKTNANKEAATHLLDTLDWANATDSTQYIADLLVGMVEGLMEDPPELVELRQDYARLEESAAAAITDIEQGYRFNQPDLIREAYRGLTGHLLHA